MQKRLYILFVALFTGICLSASANKITAYIGYASFSTPSGQTYVENYLTVMGNTVKFVKKGNDKYQGKVQVMVTYSQGDSVRKSNLYNILSPEITDTSKKVDFIDIQRYWLPKGQYTLQIKIEDLNDTAKRVVSVSGRINIGYRSDSICISDAEFLQSYNQGSGSLSKSGYDMVPYVYNYYPATVNKMNFYAEIYNVGKIIGLNQKFVVKCYIESSDRHVALYDFNNVTVQSADTVNPVLTGFDIEKLPSGNYNLVISALDKQNHILMERRYNFIRNSPHLEKSIKDLGAVSVAGTFADSINNRDTLMDDIESVWPIAGLNEREFINVEVLRNSQTMLLKQFFYNFWFSRAPQNPKQEWAKYHTQVIEVNKIYKTFSIKGYQTDRGRVYLQYGAPNQVMVENHNPSAYPYEIWEYYKLTDGEADVKFVFYEPALSTNNYVLLHSTARGEIQNRQWQLVLYSRTGWPTNIDQNNIADPFGENTLENFATPH